MGAWDVARKYPWEWWLDGEVHVLRRGEDFQVSAASFQSYAHNVAGRYGTSVAVRRLGDVVLLQGGPLDVVLAS